MSARKLLLLLLLTSLLGCDPGPEYAGLSLMALSSPPQPITLHGDGISLPAGTAVLLRALPRSSEEPYRGNYRFSLQTSDPAIMTVHPSSKLREFVLVAHRPGQTCLKVLIDGDEEECIPVTVTEPPSS